MKRVKSLISLLIFSMVVLLAVPATDAGATKKIALNKNSVALTVGKTLQLKVTGTTEKVKWTSSKKTVATVSVKGKVKAKKAGKAKITAKVAGKKLVCSVCVKAKSASEAKVSPTPSAKPEPSNAPIPEDTSEPSDTPAEKTYTFRNDTLLQEHFEKHGKDMGYATPEEYVLGANRVIASPEALHKLEAEDGDDVYYLEETNEFVIVSTDGYIRTYFLPDSGKSYFDKQSKRIIVYNMVGMLQNIRQWTASIFL